MQSRCIDRLFWTAGETLVKIISNHGGAFIVGAPLISPSPSDNDSARETWGDLDLNLPPGRASSYASVAFPTRVTPDRRRTAHGRNDGFVANTVFPAPLYRLPFCPPPCFTSCSDSGHGGEREINRSCSLANPMFFKLSGLAVLLLIFFFLPEIELCHAFI